jgi:hypothetical protein
VAGLLDSAQLGESFGALFDAAVQPTRAFRLSRAGRARDPERLVWITEEFGKEVRYDHEPLTGFWRRVLSMLLRAFAPEDLL